MSNQEFTDSGLSDYIRDFLKTFKKSNSFKYVEMIDFNVIHGKIIEIDWYDFEKPLQDILEKETEQKYHTAIYRAISEIFQIRYSDHLETVIKKDTLKFNVINSHIIENKIYGNPELEFYEKKYDASDKIDNVSKELLNKYKFITLRNSEEILTFNGMIYDDTKAITIIKEQTEKLIPNCTKHDRLEVISKIQALTYTDIEKFDSDPKQITCLNGILHLDSLPKDDHTPKNLSRVLIPCEYHKPKFDNIEDNLKDTLFWKFLKSSFTINGKFMKEDFLTVIEIMASVFVKKNIDEKAFMFLGIGNNGKSVCLNYIKSLLGSNNISSITLHDITEDRFMGANLNGKSANIFTDLEKNELRHTGKLKAIISNEGIEVQRKHGQPFTLYPFCKLLFSCNKFPKVYDQTPAFFRRWIIVKWQRNFQNDPERYEHLLEKLIENQEEKNLVFSCLIDVASKLNKVGKFTHSKDSEIIQKEWNQNADPLDDFITNYIMYSDSNKSKRETYQFYKITMLSRGEIPLTMNQFGKAFSEFFDEGRSNHERVWLNIDFVKPKQVKLEDFEL